MNRSEFAAFLHRLADAVASGDSAEGCVVYALSDRGPGELDLDIRVRTGNLDGQGGYHIIDTMPKVAVDQRAKDEAEDLKYQQHLNRLIDNARECSCPGGDAGGHDMDCEWKQETP